MLSGEPSAINAVRQMNAMRPVLFDYCVRMTGDLIASASIVSKVCESFSASHSEVHDGVPVNLRLALFRECREIGAHSWYADTSFLQNPGLDEERLRANFSGSAGAGIDAQGKASLLRLHELLRRLPGRRREALLLVERYDFSPLDSAEITCVGVAEFDQDLAAAWQVILTSLPPGSVPVANGGTPGPIKQIPLFADPTTAEHEPVTNLAEIMDELDTARRFAGMGWFGWFWLLAIAGALGWYFFL